MVFQVILFVIGLVALYYGAEWLVHGGARLARSLGVGPLVVGLTVVAFGTSTPELVVTLLAALGGTADVAIGNVVGSNIVNIGLILGASAAIAPLRFELRLLRRELPILLAVSFAILYLALDLSLGRGDGALLLVGFAFYIGFVLKAARRESLQVESEFEAFEAAEDMEPDARRGNGWNLLLIAAGIAALTVGARLLVEASLFFARAMGISELVIGLTVVAIGTSLPELATSILAAIRREADIAVGNVVGSNIFNALLILGTATTIQPFDVDSALVQYDLPVMIGFVVLLLPLGLSRRQIGRWEGVLLLVGYVAYTALLWAGAADAAPQAVTIR